MIPLGLLFLFWAFWLQDIRPVTLFMDIYGDFLDLHSFSHVIHSVVAVTACVRVVAVGELMELAMSSCLVFSRQLFSWVSVSVSVSFLFFFFPFLLAETRRAF